jgi:hypothetical protein
MIHRASDDTFGIAREIVCRISPRYKTFGMATAYVRLRMLWGALDFQEAQSSTPQYATTQMTSGGTSAAAGSGVGVRRLSIMLDRTLIETGMDPAYIHLDWLNTTSGAPDDTWTTSDYTTLETAFLSLWGTLASHCMSGCKPLQFIWHRVGTGVSKPNPAERTLAISYTTALGGGSVIPQTACSVTFRTGVRRSWGRTYLPLGSAALTTAGRVTNTAVDAITGAFNTMVAAQAANDFHLVVVSKPLASSLNVESVEVDNVPDVIRRRRYKRQTYRKILP